MTTSRQHNALPYPSAEFPLHFGIYNDRHQLLLSGHLKHRNLTDLVLDPYTNKANKVDREVLSGVYKDYLARPDFARCIHGPRAAARYYDDDFWHLFVRELDANFPEYPVELSPQLQTLLDKVVAAENLEKNPPRRGLFGGWL